jgi:hypothetical protein
MISTIFSFGSAMERKNPQAVIAAFQKSIYARRMMQF